jgi:hypothetical protein
MIILFAEASYAHAINVSSSFDLDKITDDAPPE